MAVRRPLWYNTGSIQEMDDVKINQLKDYCTLKFYASSIIELSVNTSNAGNMGTISDTRLQAGAQSTSVSAFPSEATTAEPSVVTVNYTRLNQAVNSVPGGLTSDTGNLYPCYYNSSGHIQAMNLQDMKDTLIHPTFDQIFSTDNTTAQAGTYFISTSSTASYPTSVVSSTPIFSDTRADTGAYQAGSIPEALDQPTTVTNYYLHKNLTTPETVKMPIKIDDNNNLQEYPESDFDAMISNLMSYTAVSSTDGYTLRYTLGTTAGAGTNYTKGTGIVDTRLNGSGNYQTRQVNNDDYRAQEFPNGTSTTINTYYLRLVKA